MGRQGGPSVVHTRKQAPCQPVTTARHGLTYLNGEASALLRGPVEGADGALGVRGEEGNQGLQDQPHCAFCVKGCGWVSVNRAVSDAPPAFSIPFLKPTRTTVITTGLTAPGGLPVLGVVRRDGEADLLPHLEPPVRLRLHGSELGWGCACSGK